MTRSPSWPLLLVWITVLAVFLPALRGGYVDDDLDLLISSPAFAGLGHLWDAVRAPFWGEELGYWRPLTSLLMSLGHTAGQGHPWPTHAAALLAHLASATLLFACLRRFEVASGPAALATAAFALNPCQVESVAWVAALGDPLAGAATLLAVWGWLRWRQGGMGGAPWVAWLGLALALASKESGIAAVGWLLAAELVSRLTHAPADRSRWHAWAGVVGVLLVWLVLRASVFGDWRAGFDRSSLDVGARGGHAWALRAYLASGFMALPTGWLGFTPYRWIPPELEGLARAGWPLLVWIALLLGAWIAAARRCPRLVWFGALGSAVAIAPSALVPQGLGPWPLVDRYVYLLVIGVVAVPLASRACRPWLVFLLVVVSGVASAQLVPEWRSQERVVARALRDCPRHPEPHYLVGRLQLQEAASAPRARPDARRRHDERAALAFRHVAVALRRPLYAAPHLRRVLGLNARLAEAMAASEGRLRAPEVIAAELERLADEHSDSAPVLVMLGVVRAQAGDLGRAEQAWLQALARDASAHQAAFNLGRLYAQQGRPDDARDMLRLALRLNPQNAAARALLESVAR